MLQSIGGLKQPGQACNKALNRFKVSISLERPSADPCVYYNMESGIIVELYVDNLVVAMVCEEITQNIKVTLKQSFQYATWVRWDSEGGSHRLDRTGHNQAPLDEYEMSDAKEVSTPLDPAVKFVKGFDHNDLLEGGQCNAAYRELVRQSHLGGVIDPSGHRPRCRVLESILRGAKYEALEVG